MRQKKSSRLGLFTLLTTAWSSSVVLKMSWYVTSLLSMSHSSDVKFSKPLLLFSLMYESSLPIIGDSAEKYISSLLLVVEVESTLSCAMVDDSRANALGMPSLALYTGNPQRL